MSVSLNIQCLPRSVMEEFRDACCQECMLKLNASFFVNFWPPTCFSDGACGLLQRIDCANNILARVPPSMGHLKNLKEFNLRYNSLDDRFRSKVDEGLSRWVNCMDWWVAMIAMHLRTG